MALALIDGEVTLKQFTRERLEDPEIRDLMGRIEIEEDTSLNEQYPDTLSSVAELETRDRGTIEHEVIYPKGNMRNPMTESDVVDKFRSLSAVTLKGDKGEQILQELLNLEESKPLQDLLDLLRR